MGMMASDPEDNFKRTAVRVGFYDIEKTIGKGNFAVVKLGRHRITKSMVAIKIIDKTRLDENTMVKLHREVQIMKLLRHPHILKLYQVMETQNMMYLVTEYAPNGEMFVHIDKQGKLSEDEARRVFWQIITAVEYCHNRHVVHRDLKTENLLLDENLNVKIADFGFGTISTDLLRTFCGSPPYAAPEIFEAKEYVGTAVDIWSLGVVLYVFVCAALPFDGESVKEVKDRVLEGRFRVPYFMSAELEDLIRRILVKNPSQRYTIEQIKQHPWMQADRGYAFQAEINKDVNIDLSMETGIDGDLNAQVLTLMLGLGIDTERTKRAVMEKSYDHHCAIYYLLAERLKAHRTSFPQQRRYGTRLRRASVVADQIIVQNGIVQSISGQNIGSKIQPIPRPLPYAPLQHALDHLHIGEVLTPPDMESNIPGCGREIIQPMLKPQKSIARHSPSQFFSGFTPVIAEENEDSEEHGNIETPQPTQRRSRRTGILPQPTGKRRATAPVPSEGTLFVPANHPLLRVQNDHEKPEDMRVGPGLDNSYLPNGMRIQIVAPEQMSTSMMTVHPCGQAPTVTKSLSPSPTYAFNEGRRASDGNSTNVPFMHLLRKAENEQNALQKLYKRSLTPEQIQQQQLQHVDWQNSKPPVNTSLSQHLQITPPVNTSLTQHLQITPPVNTSLTQHLQITPPVNTSLSQHLQITPSPHFSHLSQFSQQSFLVEQQLQQQTLQPFYLLEQKQQQQQLSQLYAETQSQQKQTDLMDIHHSINPSIELQKQFSQCTVTDHEDIEMSNIGGGNPGPLRRQPSYRKLSNSPIPPAHQRSMSLKHSLKNTFVINKESPYSSFEYSNEDLVS